ncbi:hypothetical protein F2P79_020889 [Pimephales promelas]|nr:hypothetical protein F2P79_020889 [Pimephales promelas]
MDTDVSPWWEDTFYEQSTQALVNTMDLVQEIILQTEYHLNQAQVEANLWNNLLRHTLPVLLLQVPNPTMRTSTNVAIGLSPLKVPALRKL